MAIRIRPEFWLNRWVTHSKMPDIFDTLPDIQQNGSQIQSKGDIFDQIAPDSMPAPRTVIGPQPDLKNRLLNMLPNANPEAIPNAIRNQPQGLKDLETIPTNFLNQLTLNHLRSFANAGDVPIPFEAKNPAINGLAKVAGFAGAMANPVTKFVGNSPNLAQLALRGGAAGAAYAPTDNPANIGERAINAGVSAIVPTAGAKITEGISKIPEGRNVLAGKIINSLIKPLKKDFSYGKNPGLAVSQENIVANDLDELAQKIGQRRNEIGKKISQALSTKQSQSIKIDIQNTLAPIDDAMTNAATQNNQALIDRLQNVRNAITRELVLGTDTAGNKVIQTTGDRNLASLTPLEATKIKTHIGDLTKWTGNMTDDQLVNKALKNVYGGIKDKIGNAVPAIKPLNERYADLTSAEIATKYRDVINQKNALINIKMAAGGGVVGALLSGGQPIWTILSGVGLEEINRLLESPAAKTRVAAWLSTATNQQKQSLLAKNPNLNSLFKKLGAVATSRMSDKLMNGKS